MAKSARFQVYRTPELRLSRNKQKKKPTHVLCHISKLVMTLFNGTVRKTALYSVLALREKRIYLIHAREKEKKSDNFYVV